MPPPPPPPLPLILFAHSRLSAAFRITPIAPIHRDLTALSVILSLATAAAGVPGVALAAAHRAPTLRDRGLKPRGEAAVRASRRRADTGSRQRPGGRRNAPPALERRQRRLRADPAGADDVAVLR